jgi:hypothetical protein
LRNLYLNFALGELRMGRGVFAELLAFSSALGLLVTVDIVA